MHRIITIGREFGSGGREFGRRLAEELGIEYYGQGDYYRDFKAHVAFGGVY